MGIYRTQGFFTQDLFCSTSLPTWGSSRASKGGRFFNELIFHDFVCYVSAKIEQLSKTSKIELKDACLWQFLKVYSILAEKQWTKSKKTQFHEEFHFAWCPIWPSSGETSGDVSGFTLCFKFDNSSALYIFLTIFKVIPKVSTSFDSNIQGYATDYLAI